MSKEASFAGRVMSAIAAAAALVTVGSVGYCVRKNEEGPREPPGQEQAVPERFEAEEPEQKPPRRETETESDDPSPEPRRRVAPEVPPEDEPDGIDEKVEEDVADVTVVNGIRFELIGCHRNGGTITCNLSLTSVGRDIKDVYLTTDSLANASGSEVSAARASFGTIQNHRIHGWGDLAADVPKSGSLRFEGLGVNEPRLTLLEIKMVVGSERFSVRFRDVAVT